MSAKKSYGQHFLLDESIAAAIANSLTFNGPTDQVLEIGPGKGMLTKYLLEKPFGLRAIEADWDMMEYLYKQFPDFSEQLVYADFLKADIGSLFGESPFSIVGNFPYNISSQIVFKMLDHKESIPQLVGMFQKEVAQRITSAPKVKAYGIISVLVQAWYRAEYLFEVDRTKFAPPPKVQSAVIRLTRKENMELGCPPKLFKAVVKQAFSQRRKMLRNTMKAYIKGHPLLEEDFFRQRPEQLSVEDFVWLTQQIEGIRGGAG